jgi:hypothetical protein
MNVITLYFEKGMYTNQATIIRPIRPALTK